MTERYCCRLDKCCVSLLDVRVLDHRGFCSSVFDTTTLVSNGYPSCEDVVLARPCPRVQLDTGNRS